LASRRTIPTIMDSDVTPEHRRFMRKHLTRQEFGKRLYDLILEKGWTQSELARRAGVLRDSISSYVNGKILPEPLNLKKLADALDVSSEDLLPNYTEQAIETQAPVMEIITSGEDPQRSIVRINRIVKTSAIPAILKALEEGN
jgi:transcriptional regulator with XRE-family HTH domain